MNDFLKSLGIFCGALIFVLSAVFLSNKMGGSERVIYVDTSYEKKIEQLNEAISILSARLDKKDKDWESLMNYYCLHVDTYAGGTQKIIHWPTVHKTWGLPGRCEKGFKN